MKKEEILEMSKEENKIRDVYEIKIDSDARKIAGLAIVVLASLYYSYEIFMGKGVNPALFSIVTIYDAVLCGYKAYKMEHNRKLNILCTVIWLVLSIIFILQYLKVI